MRKATYERKTKETEVKVEVVLDGKGKYEIDSGLPFLNHMLALLSTHSGFDLKIYAHGNLEVDQHHTVEDIGICLGEAIKEALGDKAGIERYGYCLLPMDECLVIVALDLSGRAHLVYDVTKLRKRLQAFDTELIEEFMLAFCRHAGITLHIKKLYGRNTHHILEAIFKGLGYALKQAVAKTTKRAAAGIPSSKGIL